MRNWTDADTAILCVYTAGPALEEATRQAPFFFILKFDLEGKCKITSAQKIAQKDIEG